MAVKPEYATMPTGRQLRAVALPSVDPLLENDHFFGLLVEQQQVGVFYVGDGASTLIWRGNVGPGDLQVNGLLQPLLVLRPRGLVLNALNVTLELDQDGRELHFDLTNEQGRAAYSSQLEAEQPISFLRADVALYDALLYSLTAERKNGAIESTIQLHSPVESTGWTPELLLWAFERNPQLREAPLDLQQASILLNDLWREGASATD